MHIDEIHRMRDDKDMAMRRNGYEQSPYKFTEERDNFTKDMFGGMHGVDPNSHGVELQ